MKWLYILKCISVIAVSFCFSLENWNSNNKFTIESRGPFTESLLTKLRDLDFTVLHKITESVYIFKYEGLLNSEKIPGLIMRTVEDKVNDIEPTRAYVNTLKPASSNNENHKTTNMTNLVCKNYYGLGVEKVWKRNITGLGVTIAINDVGIDTDLDDLEQNIDKELSIDLFKNKTDISPEHFENVVENPPEMSAHGDHVTSVIAAVKGNNLCSAGIAYNATVVGIKMWKIELKKNEFHVKTKAEIISRALNYMHDKIDIYVNALRPVSHFDQLDLATRTTIKDAALRGRKGLGAINVVPAGPYGNALSNNIYTITVNGLPRPGKSFTNVNHDSSVLTSGLRDGNNLMSAYMVTTIYGNKCVISFNGDSAAVAQVSGIIALGLQARPSLKLRDVQHLLVQASGFEKISRRVTSKINAVSRKFNETFGFGLLDAEKFVHLAENHVAVPDMTSIILSKNEKRYDGLHTEIFDFCESCDREKQYIDMLEHVAIDISFKALAGHVKLHLFSPGKTVSFLMDFALTENDTLVTHTGNFVSVHFWDEVPCGKWQAKVQSDSLSKNTIIYNISITLYGTSRANQSEDQDYCGSDDTNKVSVIVLACVAFFLLLLPILLLCACLNKRYKFLRQICKVLTCDRPDDRRNDGETTELGSTSMLPNDSQNRPNDRGNKEEITEMDDMLPNDSQNRPDDRGNEEDNVTF